jgi:hypothetical protein
VTSAKNWSATAWAATSPFFIVQAAADFLKRAKMRLDKGNAWDKDKDKLKEALMEMRQYMAQIDGSVPPGV